MALDGICRPGRLWAGGSEAIQAGDAESAGEVISRLCVPGGDAGAEATGARDHRVPGRDVPDVVAHASMFRGSVSNALTRCVGSSKRRASSATVGLGICRMRRRLLTGLLFGVLAAGLLLGVSVQLASAAQVVVLGRDGRVALRNDPHLHAPTMAGPRASVARVKPGSRHRAAVSVRSVLRRLYRRHLITGSAYRRYAASFNAANRVAKRLSGARAAELKAVIANMNGMAARGMLTRSRLPVLFLTLDRNRQWWTRGSLLSYGQRVEFAGSQLVWEYYPGQGIELQQLGSFGKAQWYCSHGVTHAARCQEMLAELVPLAVDRAGGLTWEYYFTFDGGAPPWTSAMSQGTALQALADASRLLGDSAYLEIAKRALPVFGAAPPVGVRVKTSRGARYVQYSFAPAPGQNVLNGFLQSLIGLSDYARTSGDPVAGRLFAAGDAEARAEVPHFDTGAWSLYQPGQEDTLDYHELVTGFLRHLCRITHASVYCNTAAAFKRDLRTPPVLSLITKRLRAKSPPRSCSGSRRSPEWASHSPTAARPCS